MIIHHYHIYFLRFYIANNNFQLTNNILLISSKKKKAVMNTTFFIKLKKHSFLVIRDYCYINLHRFRALQNTHYLILEINHHRAVVSANMI